MAEVKSDPLDKPIIHAILMTMNESVPAEGPKHPEGFLGRKTTRRKFLFKAIAGGTGLAAAGLVGCDWVQTRIDSITGNSGSGLDSNLPGTPEATVGKTPEPTVTKTETPKAEVRITPAPSNSLEDELFNNSTIEDRLFNFKADVANPDFIFPEVWGPLEPAPPQEKQNAYYKQGKIATGPHAGEAVAMQYTESKDGKPLIESVYVLYPPINFPLTAENEQKVRDILNEPFNDKLGFFQKTKLESVTMSGAQAMQAVWDYKDGKEFRMVYPSQAKLLDGSFKAVLIVKALRMFKYALSP